MMQAQPAMEQRRSVDEKFHDIVASGVIWVWLMFWLMEAFMNARFGWRLVGGGVSGVPMGALLFGVAVLGAYLPMRYRDIGRTDPHRRRRRFVLGALVVMCFSVCQAAGWANLGTMLADGATARDTQATARSTAKDDIERLREERRALKINRPVAAIEAALSLEMRRTSRAYPNGDGPAALQLKEELARAQRAAELDKALPTMVSALGQVAQIAEGRPELDVLKRIFAGVGEKEISFWIPPVLTALIGVVATFGPVLIGLRIPAAGAHGSPLAPPLAGYLPPADIFDAYRGGNPHHPHQAAPVAYAWAAPAPDGASAPAGAGGPITINVGGATANGPGGVPAAISRAASDGRGVIRRVAMDTSVDRARAGMPYGVPATPAAGHRPVDRTRLNVVIDQLMTFVAAELLCEAGAVVPLPAMIERYQVWAQGRGIDPASFAIMFPIATGIEIVDVGGVQHFVGARLRRPMKLVGGAQ